jgi:hypothetical protein
MVIHLAGTRPGNFPEIGARHGKGARSFQRRQFGAHTAFIF